MIGGLPTHARPEHALLRADLGAVDGRADDLRPDGRSYFSARSVWPSLGLVAPIVRSESKGFIINRIWRAVKRESLRVVDDGVATPEDIDRLWMIFFQTEYAPFGVMDMVGLDVVPDIEWSYQRTPSIRPTSRRPALAKMIDDGKLGEKSGRGSTPTRTRRISQPRLHPGGRRRRNSADVHVVFLVTRKPDMSQDEFIDYWINGHTPLTAKVPGVRLYRCYPMIATMGDQQPPFDAVACSRSTTRPPARPRLNPEFTAAVGDGVNFQNIDETTASSPRSTASSEREKDRAGARPVLFALVVCISLVRAYS